MLHNDAQGIFSDPCWGRRVTDGQLVYGRVIANRNEKVQRQVDHVKIRIGMQIDDTHFKNLLADTQVRKKQSEGVNTFIFMQTPYTHI